MKTPSVLFIRRHYTPFGGAEMTVSELANRLARSGVKVGVAASSWEDTAPSIKIVRVRSPRKPSWLGALVFALRCRNDPRISEFDIVFSLDRTFDQDFYRAGDGCHRSWLKHRALVDGWLRGRVLPLLRPFNWVMLEMEKRVFDKRRTKFIVANSDMVSREIVEEYGFPPDRISVVRNGVDRDRFAAVPRKEARNQLLLDHELSSSDRIILFLGSGFHRKGLKYAIEVLEGLGDKHVLLVVGKGRTAPYKRMARALKVGSRVRFVGPVKNPDLYIRGSDLLLLPTLYDPSSNACLEALAAGTPVVTTRSNGAAEVIEQGVSGWIAEDPGDIHGMITGCQRLLSADHPGFRLATRIPDWENSVDSLYRVMVSRFEDRVAEEENVSK